MLSNSELYYHTSKVYELILMMLMSYSVGCYTEINIFGHSSMSLALSAIGAFIFLFASCESTSANAKFYNTMAMSGCLGMTAGYVVDYANLLDSSIVPFSLVMTIAVFSGFTIVSRVVDNNDALATGAICCTLLNMLMYGSILSLFIPLPEFVTSLQVIISLMTFCGFIIFDTKKMHIEFSTGNINYYKHAIALFLDFVNIFVNLLVTLIKDTEEKEKEKRERKRAQNKKID